MSTFKYAIPPRRATAQPSRLQKLWWKVRFGFAWFLIIVGGLGALRVAQSLEQFGFSFQLGGYAVAKV